MRRIQRLRVPLQRGVSAPSGVDLSPDTIAPDGSEPIICQWYLARIRDRMASGVIVAGPFAAEDQARQSFKDEGA